MYSRIKKAASALLGLAVVGCGSWIIYKITLTAWHAFTELNPQVAAALVTGFFTVTVSVSAVVVGRYLEKTKEINAAYRDKRVKVYEEYISNLLNLMRQGGKQDADIASFLREFNKNVLLWAGPRALKAYTVFFVKISQDATSAETVFAMEDFFKAVRRDLGLGNNGLQKGDFLALILRIDDLLVFLSEYKRNPLVRLGDVDRIKKETALRASASAAADAQRLS